MADTPKHQTDPQQWVNLYADTMFRYAIVRVNDEETARELVQEAFFAAIKNIGSYKGEVPEKNWLMTILKNKVIDFYRQKARQVTERLPEYDIEDNNEYFDDSGHWAAGYYPREWGQEGGSAMETKEFYAVLEKCKGRLREVQQAVFSLKYIDEKESDEICKELNISSSNYWVLIHRAKLQIRQCLEKHWFMK